MREKIEYLVKLSGQNINNYKVEEKIWQGATSTVYRCTDFNGGARYGKVAAIKVLHPYRNKAVQIKQFIREAKLQKRLLNNNIVKVYGIERKNRYIMMFMEYIEGSNLKLNIENMSTESLIKTFISIADTIGFIHHRGIIHNDIKPENIIVGNKGAVKLTDFGSAVKLGRWSGVHKDSVGGTEKYMAPERIKGFSCYSSDIYSFGILIDEFLKDRLKNEKIYSIIVKATQQPLHKRYSSAAELKRDLVQLYLEFMASNENRNNF